MRATNRSLAFLLGALVFAGCDPRPETSNAAAVNKDAAVQPATMAIPARFDEAGQFSEGLAPVRIGGKFGYVDTQGEVVIPPQFDFANPFSEGVAAAGAGNAV